MTRPLGGEPERHEPAPGLFLFDLPQPLPGFRRFVSAWFFVDDRGRRVLVDPGPASSIPFLLGGLEPLTDGLDLVLLTHIHLDHSGGLKALCARYPDAAVLAHRRAARHLMDPSRLWNASLATLGPVAQAYGEPEPIDGARLIFEDEAGLVEVLETTGHASHHLSFRVSCGGRRLLFAGEAAGLSLPTEDGEMWLRPASPPPFDATAALGSLDRLERFLEGDELFCYAHWGAVEGSLERVALAKRQIQDWLEVVRSMQDEPLETIVDRLMAKDPFLRASIPDDLRERERIFMGNSVRGFLGFLRSEGYVRR
ncbi:MAG: MBL fold metallo-hydrolase [Fretibacterium sp.]|nr:MBL fold metallo-hydrolase [Fretibacterium sp.]